MDLHLGHELLLLHLDDGNGKGRLPEGPLAVAYGGAVLCQWRLDGQLVRKGPKAHVLETRGSRWASLRAAEAVVPEEPLSLVRLLDKIRGWRASNRYGPALEELRAAGCVEPVKDTLLGMPWRTRWPERDGKVERALIRRLRTHLETVDEEEPLSQDDALIAILAAVGLLDTVWTSTEVELLASRIESRARLSAVARAVRSMVKVDRLLSGVPKL